MHGVTPEERAFRDLDHRAELRHAFRSVMDGKPLTGAAKELQEHRGLSGHDLPWDLVAPRPVARTEARAEHRVDAVSAAPADSHLQQQTILGRVFARSATAALGVAMPMVATGEQNFPVVTTSDTASILAKDAAEGDAADAGITAHVISPTRLQRSYVFRREDQAVLAGLEEALRADLSMAVSDLLDQQVLAGDGSTGAEFPGFLATAANGGIGNRGDSPARVTFALAAGETARGIDGKFAGGLSECAVVIGDDTARDLAGKFQNQDSDSALAYMSRTTARAMASANIPAVAADFQEAVLARMGAAGANAVCPTWGLAVHGARRNLRQEVRSDRHHHRDPGWILDPALGRLRAAEVQGLVAHGEGRTLPACRTAHCAAGAAGIGRQEDIGAGREDRAARRRRHAHNR